MKFIPIHDWGWLLLQNRVSPEVIAV